MMYTQVMPLMDDPSLLSEGELLKSHPLT